MPKRKSKVKKLTSTPTRSAGLRPRKLPFSLLGQIVYKSGTPIARIHDVHHLHSDDDSDNDLTKQCLVSGRLEHVEFDLSTLPEVVNYVWNAYPKGRRLTKNVESLLARLALLPDGVDTDTLGIELFREPNSANGSPSLTDRCAFVGELLYFARKGYCVRAVDAFSEAAFWEAIRSVGCVSVPSHKGSLHMDPSHLSVIHAFVVGRIIVVETVSAEILVALHTALEHYFAVTASIDLYAGYATLGPEIPYDEMVRGTNYRARHYAINFLYVVTHEERRKLTSWHKERTSVLYDDRYPADFYVGQGTTAIQLSEELERDGALSTNGPFKTWSALVIPAIPALRPWREHRMPVDIRLANASEAWLWIIAEEHRYAYTYMADLFQKISDKVSPPQNFMFNLSYIDELLFDDENYTKSKLYFWAYQSLEMVQSTLRAIIAQWRKYRANSDIFPTTTTPNDAEWHGTYTSRLKDSQSKIDGLMRKLEELTEDCKAKQREIAALRDGLFNGSAVLESRNSLRAADQSLEQTKTAIAQGENIKALTLVSIFFLPLAFVTSIFGMTNIPQDANMKAFAAALICICVPTYAFIGSMMNEKGIKAWGTVLQRLNDMIPQSLKLRRYRTVGDLAKAPAGIANWEFEPTRGNKTSATRSARTLANRPAPIAPKKHAFRPPPPDLASENRTSRPFQPPSNASGRSIRQSLSEKKQEEPTNATPDARKETQGDVSPIFHDNDIAAMNMV